MTPLQDRPDLLVTERPGLVVLLMRKAPTEASFTACSAGIADVLTRQTCINTLVLIPAFDGLIRPSRDGRQAFVEVMGQLGARNLGTCIVVSVPGVPGTMIRLSVNAALMFRRQNRPIHISHSIAGALRWLRELPGQLPEVLDAPSLEGELLQLR